MYIYLVLSSTDEVRDGEMGKVFPYISMCGLYVVVVCIAGVYK